MDRTYSKFYNVSQNLRDKSENIFLYGKDDERQRQRERARERKKESENIFKRDLYFKIENRTD